MSKGRAVEAHANQQRSHFDHAGSAEHLSVLCRWSVASIVAMSRDRKRIVGKNVRMMAEGRLLVVGVGFLVNRVRWGKMTRVRPGVILYENDTICSAGGSVL